MRTVLLHFAGETDATATVFSFSVFEQARQYLADVVLPIEAKPFLGITRAAFVQLVDRGLVVKDDLFAKLFPESLARYSKMKLQSVIDTARSVPAVASRDGLVALAKAPLKTHTSYADVVALLLERKLSRVYYDLKLPGLASIFVDPVEAASHFQVGEEWMFAEEAAALIGVEAQTVYLMTREGVLTAHKLRRPGYHSSTIFLDRNEVNKFHATYASSTGLSEGTTMTTGSVAQILKSRNIPKVRAGPVVFYERKDARKALAELIAA
ncbi:hypothetical protein QA644_24280 (plasmid) [Rhizobium sp. CC1099]|uniref:hypothetical protein n=1 Tax=Rhizobium sp. CC1099 TaxID=3039160 RepID=UPI0024B08964|nr:hypothetical protein [Rhizobium sp. CC1099]WFU91313.1 hypothetical protein QA644_24280 [Rhizobium sp. CC1099]